VKTCSKCKQIKVKEEFGKHKNGKNGLDSRCKTCLTQYRKSMVANSNVRNKAWYEANKDRKSLYNKIWKEANLEHLSDYNSVYQTNRYKTDIEYKLKVSLRSRLNKAISGNYKSGSAVEDLGCTIDELKVHLEVQFKSGMSWDNHGRFGWHIDHIDPLTAFDLTDPVQVKTACNFKNLQPLWWKENILKGGA
jgi:hypothetical protein